VPLSNFVPRGFGFVHHSIAILYHEVPNPNLTIRNFFIAVRRRATGLVRYLIDSGADPRARAWGTFFRDNHFGELPLNFAVRTRVD
jgi:hypothetical protein